MTAPLYYPTWISPNRPAGGWSWGPPCDSPGQAAAVVKARVAEGASMGVVVKMIDGMKTPMESYVWPPSARGIVRHWERLWDATETDR